MKRNGFLINTLNPELVKSEVFEVREGAVRLTVSGLDPLDADTVFVKLQKQIKTPESEVWVDLYRNSYPIRLSGANIDYIELITGIYRVVSVGVTDENVVIAFEEDEKRLDNRVNYVYVQNQSAANTGSGGGGGSGLQYWIESQEAGSWSSFTPKNNTHAFIQLIDSDSGISVGQSSDSHVVYPLGPNGIRIKPAGIGYCGERSIVIGGYPGNGTEGTYSIIIGHANSLSSIPNNYNIALSAGPLAFLGSSNCIFNPGDDYAFIPYYGNAYVECLGINERLLTPSSIRYKHVISGSILTVEDNACWLLLRGETLPTVFSPGMGAGNTITIPHGKGIYTAKVIVSQVGSINTWFYEVSGVFHKHNNTEVVTLSANPTFTLLSYVGSSTDPFFTFNHYADTGTFFLQAVRGDSNFYRIKADIEISMLQISTPEEPPSE